MSKSRRRDNLGAASFERFYGELYGERWDELRRALVDSSRTTSFAHRLSRPYVLDPASVLAAVALEVESDSRVLDLCAAPGGKTLVLASDLGADGSLVSNERSSARRARLHRVLDAHLPADLRSRVTITGHDAARWALHEPAAYDRILADVPCSSEQHVLLSAGALAQWSPSRTRRLAQGAYAIGCAAVDALKPGGRVVYSTCALSPLENDGVVARLLERGSGDLSVTDAEPILERAAARYRDLLPEQVRGRTPGARTEHGWMILPDTDAGMGPMYIAIVGRTLR